MSQIIKQVDFVTRWYVCPGCLPIKVQVQLTGRDFAWCPAQYRSLRNDWLFETERDALQYALKQKKEAREMVEKEYAAILDQIDKMETAEVAKEF